MKVLHVIPSVGPLRGGPSFALRTLTQALHRQEVEVHVCTTDDNGPQRLPVQLAEPVTEAGVVYHYFPRQLPYYLVSLPLSRWLHQHVSDYDLVHIHAVFSFAATAAAAACRARNVPYLIRPLGVLNQWGMQNRRRRLKQISLHWVEMPMIERASLMHYTSEDERLEAHHSGVWQPSIVLPNPTDPPVAGRASLRGSFRSRFQQLENQRIVLFLSRIDRKKGLDLLLRAFVQIATIEPSTALVIAGDGDPEYTEELRRLSFDLGIAKKVFWAGFLSGSVKQAALADADVFVLPSHSENFGNAVVEAMYMEAPVVVSENVPVCREILAHDAGLVTRCEPEALAAAVLRILTSEDGGARLAANALRLAQEAFSSEAVIRRLLMAYESMCQSSTALRCVKEVSLVR